MKTQSIRQIFAVTEWRDGCVYRTKSTGFAWVTTDTRPPNENVQYHSISTSMLTKLNHRTMRTVPDSTPDVVPVEVTK